MEKNGNFKDSQCGTLSVSNYIVSCSSGNICKTQNAMRVYYYQQTGDSSKSFGEYYNIPVAINNAGISPKINIENPFIDQNDTQHKFYKDNNVYWVKDGYSLTVRFHTTVKDGGATYQQTLGALKSVNNGNTVFDYIEIPRGFNVTTGKEKHTVNSSYYPSTITTDNIKSKNGFIYKATAENRTGYDNLYTRIEIAPAKGQRPKFYAYGAVTNGNGSILKDITSSNYLNIWADGTAPTINFEGHSSSWRKNDQTIKVSATDTESGVKSCYFVDGSNNSIGTIKICLIIYT